MRLLISGLVLGAIGISVAQVSARFSSESNYFSAQFPGKVDESKSITSWSTGQLTSSVFVSQSGSGLFRVTVTPLPREVIRGRSAQDLLDAARDGTLTMKRMTVEAEQKLLVNGAPGRRFIVNTPDSPSVVHLVVVANGRLYQASAAVPNSELSRGVDFVKSFNLNAVISSGG
ncbi:MAG: hypothetical protein ACKVQS_06445 [Fimbriimonadaceae bacterium]